MRKFMSGKLGPSGTLLAVRIPAVPFAEVGLGGLLRTISRGLPWFGLPREVLLWRVKNLPNLWRGAWRALLAAAIGVPFMTGALYIRVTKPDGRVIDYGVASLRLVTNNGVGFIVDAFQNLVEMENMKYHGIGTGTVAEAQTDSALGTELTTEYNPDNTRATGSLTENGSNVFRTVGTNTIDSGTPAVTEHGLFTQAATGGGTLLDRSKFAAINLVSGDSIQTTYDLTLTAGS